MNEQLEDYLKDLSGRLSPLPAARREDELREMRQHLEDAVLAACKHGHPSDEAVASILEEFGTPADVGERVVTAWRRDGDLRGIRYFLGTMTCLIVVGLLDVSIHPRHLAPDRFIMILWLLLFGWKYVSPRYRPAWWAFRQRPIGVMPCVLFTVLAPIWVVTSNGNWQKSASHGGSALWSLVWYGIMTWGLWLRHSREERTRATMGGR